MPSSVVDSFEYLADTRILRVKFNSGLTYDYKNVPQEVYKSF
ncbi:KTSC domain-containing protein, partial [Daejeonella sp.]